METEDIERIWVELSKNKGDGFRLKYLELKNLIETFEKLNPDEDPYKIDWSQIIDPTLSYSENLRKLKEAYPMYKWEESEISEEAVEDEYTNYIYNEAERLGIIDQIKKELEAEIEQELKTEIINQLDLDEIKNGLAEKVKAMTLELSDKAMASIDLDKIVKDIVQDSIKEVRADLKAMAKELIQDTLDKHVKELREQSRDREQPKAKKPEKAKKAKNPIQILARALVAAINGFVFGMSIIRYIQVNGINLGALPIFLMMLFFSWLSDIALVLIFHQAIERNRKMPNPIGMQYGRPK